MGTITGLNSSFQLNIPDVFTTPILMKGYAVDDAFNSENIAMTETRLGADGILSGGAVPYTVKLRWNLMPDSPTTPFMDQLIMAMLAARETFVMSATIIMPSISRIYTFNRGFMKEAMPMPKFGKVLDPQPYMAEFNTYNVGPYQAA